MNYDNKSRQFFNSIRKAGKVLVISHAKPDGDTVGANLALLHFLEREGKEFRSFCPTPPPKEFSFLPKSFYLKSDQNVFLERFDLVVVLDSGDLRYAGLEEHLDKISGAPILNIDHHPTNEHFGYINIVDDRASSTTEIIYKLFQKENILIEKNIATCLLTGILTDTSNFSNPATTYDVLGIASELLSSGASYYAILKNALSGQPVPVLKLWGEILSRLQMNEYGMAVTVVTKDDWEAENLDEDALSGMANFLNNLDGVEAVLILKEEGEGFVRGSMRTSKEDLDLSELAKFFGGGGHKKAAGFSIPGKISKDQAGRWVII